MGTEASAGRLDEEGRIDARAHILARLIYVPIYYPSLVVDGAGIVGGLYYRILSDSQHARRPLVERESCAAFGHREPECQVLSGPTAWEAVSDLFGESAERRFGAILPAAEPDGDRDHRGFLPCLSATRPGCHDHCARLWHFAWRDFCRQAEFMARLRVHVLGHDWDISAGVRNRPVLDTGAGSDLEISAHWRLGRASMLEVLRKDYIRTARAKGLAEWTVLVGHALKNSLIPVITVAGSYLTFIITGSFFVESICAVPGIGRYFVTSITARDYPVIMGTVLLLAAVASILNLLVDIVYAFLDPRVHYQ
jgi:hypothetical protein